MPTRELVPALQDQIGKLIHSSNYYHVPLQEQLAAKLTRAVGADATSSSAAPASRPTRRR